MGMGLVDKHVNSDTVKGNVRGDLGMVEPNRTI
jgi:hypothetical protein